MRFPALRTPVLFSVAVFAATVFFLAALPAAFKNVQINQDLTRSRPKHLRTVLYASLILSGFLFGFSRHAASCLPTKNPTVRVAVKDAAVPPGTSVALRAVPDPGTGLPALDARARWRFTADSSASAAGDGASRTLFLPARHVAEFARPRPDRFSAANCATILGRVTDDPAVYNASTDDPKANRRTILEVTPAFVRPAGSDVFQPVSSGKIQVSLNCSPGLLDAVADSGEENGQEDSQSAYAAAFLEVSRASGNGADVVITGQLELPRAPASEEDFDFRAYLEHRGILAQVFVFDWQIKNGFPNPFAIVRPEGAETPRRANPLIRHSLALRDRMLGVIRETLPYPVSAFAGGITLGMRYGLQSAECVRPGCEGFISEEFKRSGVNHVLAVSGLHVTIITALLVGLLSLCKLSKKAYVPVVLFALVVFAVITGARPSTLRAVIMNGLFLILWAYTATTISASILVSASIAAVLILLQNPRILTEPSFTLSFAAILSLAILTPPSLSVLSRFRGNNLLALFLVVLLANAAVIADWHLLASPRGGTLFLLLAALVFAAARLAERRGVKPVGNFGFTDLPVSVHGFIAAQLAIQLGMMIPLSAYYFQRWSAVGSVANLVAIPLVGIVLQLAMLSCIVGLIPGVGVYLALVLNAANWIGCHIFLDLAHYASEFYPFPFVPRVTGTFLVGYYLLMAAFYYHEFLLRKLHNLLVDLFPRRGRRRLVLASLGAAVLVAVALWVFLPASARAPETIDFRLGKRGSARLVIPAEGLPTLYDAGPTQRTRNRASQAERVILPRLSTRHIGALEALVITQATPECLDGAALVLESVRVERLVLPPGLAGLFDPATNELRADALDRLLPQNSDDPSKVDLRQAILEGQARAAATPSLAKVLRRHAPTPFRDFLGVSTRVEAARAQAAP